VHVVAVAVGRYTTCLIRGSSLCRVRNGESGTVRGLRAGTPIEMNLIVTSYSPTVKGRTDVLPFVVACCADYIDVQLEAFELTLYFKADDSTRSLSLFRGERVTK
jgi:hypothetical protein